MATLNFKLLLSFIFLIGPIIALAVDIKPGGSRATNKLNSCLVKNRAAITEANESLKIQKIRELCGKEYNKIIANINSSYEASAKYNQQRAKNIAAEQHKALSNILYEFSGEKLSANKSTGEGSTIPKMIPLNSKPEKSESTTSAFPLNPPLETSGAGNQKTQVTTEAEKVEDPASQASVGKPLVVEEKPSQVAEVKNNTDQKAYSNCVSKADSDADFDKCNKDYPGATNQETREQVKVETLKPSVKPLVSDKAQKDLLTNLKIIKPTVSTESDTADLASEEEDEGLEVLHADHRNCLNPQWIPGLDKKIIGIDGANCSPSQASKRISACIRFVECKKKATKEGEADSFFMRQALCAPNECGDEDGQAQKCLASNHAIYQDPAEALNKTNAKTGRSFIEEKSQYKIIKTKEK